MLYYLLCFYLLYMILLSQACNCQNCPTQKSHSCIFPFEYKNKIYSACIREDDEQDKSWCSIKVDSDGQHIKGNNGVTWDFCSSDCPRECEGNAQCVNRNDCPQYQEFKKIAKSQRPPDYQSQRNKWVASICNKKEKKLCCSVTPKLPTLVGDRSNTAEVPNKGWKRSFPKKECLKFKISHPYYQKLEEKWRAQFNGMKDRQICLPESQDMPGNYLPKHGECGGNYFEVFPTRIIGGSNATFGEFPWSVLLGYKVKIRSWENKTRTRGIKDTTQYKCGGTLINTRYVLTAAHCLDRNKKVSSVVLGEWDVGADSDCPHGNQDPECVPRKQVIEVESVIKHEDYTRNKLNGVLNDIALIRLSKHAILNVGVQPICLPLNEEDTAEDIGADNLEDGIVGREATVVGWGATRNYQRINPDLGVVTNILQKVDIPIVSNDDCKSELTTLIGPKHICAGQEGSSRDSCKGDSGGGMFIRRKSIFSTQYQIGIVSYGSPQCGIGSPGVYTRVTKFIPWISSNIVN